MLGNRACRESLAARRITSKAGGFGPAALARIARFRRIWAPRPLHRGAFARVIILVFSCHDLRRRHAVLRPVRERRDHVMGRIVCWGRHTEWAAYCVGPAPVPQCCIPGAMNNR